MCHSRIADIESSACGVQLANAVFLKADVAARQQFDKCIGNRNGTLADDGIADDYQASASGTKNALPLSEAGVHILKVTVRCCTWPREFVMRSDLDITRKCDIAIDPVKPLPMVLVVVVGV